MLRVCSRSINCLFIEVTERGIVENLLLLQCEDRLAGQLLGHLESSRVCVHQRTLKKSVVIHHIVICILWYFGTFLLLYILILIYNISEII